jgi:signal transduction histidine kinase
MSATTRVAHTREVPRRLLGPWPIDRLAVATVVAADLAILGIGVATLGLQLLESAWDIGLWTLAVAAAGMAAIQLSGGAQLGLDMPLLLAAGYVLGPIPAGLIAFAGYVDLREFKRRIRPERAIFNRAQTSLSVMAATAVFSLVAGAEASWPFAMVGAMAALCIDTAVNVTLVVGVMALHERAAPRIAFDRLRLGSVADFVGTYASFGLLSLLLAEIYSNVGGWGLLTFVLPLFLARKAFSQTQRLERANMKIDDQRIALQRVSASIADERRDERLAIAAGLHDDVLPPLYQVHLLGQVLKQQMATGQLLAMETDLPELVNATIEASSTVRSLIRNLRLSPLGLGGLAHTLRLLVAEMNDDQSIHISSQLDDVRGTPVVELLAYQVAREALRNAVRHSKATRITILLCLDGDDIRLVVQDDGVGFSPATTDESRHFGLALMRERVELGGGVVGVDSRPGEGTCVVVRLPARRGGSVSNE